MRGGSWRFQYFLDFKMPKTIIKYSMCPFSDDVSVLPVRNTRGSRTQTHKSILTQSVQAHKHPHPPSANIPLTSLHIHSSCPTSRDYMKSKLTHPITQEAVWSLPDNFSVFWLHLPTVAPPPSYIWIGSVWLGNKKISKKQSCQLNLRFIEIPGRTPLTRETGGSSEDWGNIDIYKNKQRPGEGIREGFFFSEPCMCVFECDYVHKCPVAWLSLSV